MTRCESKHLAHIVINIFQELYEILLCLTVVILSFISRVFTSLHLYIPSRGVVIDWLIGLIFSMQGSNGTVYIS